MRATTRCGGADSDADSDSWGGGVRDRLSDAFGQACGQVEREMVDYDEFLPAQARDQCFGARCCADVLSDFDQHLVTNEMTVLVIDLLESVDINNQRAHCCD